MITGGLFLYIAVRNNIYNQIDDSLMTEKNIIQDQIEQTDTIPDFSATFGHQIEVRFLNNIVKTTEAIHDTVIHDSISGEDLPYRYIYYRGNTVRNQGYSIRIMQVLSEKMDLLETIALYTFYLFLVLLLISLVLNYIVSRKLWKPFYRTVEKAENFNLVSDESFDLPETDILEFNQLNRVIQRMTLKMKSDYHNLKEFSENAAHEIQTPLAIIRAKTELLMQGKNMKKENLVHIKSINEAISRLFKLNQGLLVISKIENQYYYEARKISLKEILENYIDNYREILNLKKIRVEEEISSDAFVVMNEVLADILISNLLSNAVRYNVDGGFIKCRIDDESVIISNSGLPLQSDPELLFRRFYKKSDNPKSLGLGLSIVKKIVDNYRMSIRYTYRDSVHELRLDYHPVSVG
jgi:signal transduction histidine kinase